MNKKLLSERDKQKSRPVNLIASPEQQYYCEDCNVILALYPSTLAAQQFPFERGPHYICPNCHLITDSSLDKLPGVEEIKPLDISVPTFIAVAEDKGDKITIPKPYDPEPNEEQWLKNIGATLISKRIDVKSDF